MMTGICGAHGTAATVRCDSSIGIAVAIGHHLSAVDMSHGPNFGHILARTVDGVIMRQKMLAGKLVRPFHGDGLAFANLDGWSGPQAVVSPHRRGRQIAVRSMTER